MTDVVAAVDVFVVTIPRDEPYLGTLADGDVALGADYVVRAANGTIYPRADRSIVVRVTTRGGAIGWGETYGLVAPAAVAALVADLIAPFVTGRDPHDAGVLWDDLYDLMRVRGYTGGFWLDAIAAVDIALWDVAARLVGLPLCQLLGGRRRERIPAYVSGLPAPTLAARQDLARQAVADGYRAIKLAAVHAPGAIVREVAAIREAVGPDVALMLDLHWTRSPAEAVALIARLHPYDLSFVEAPCKPEDVEGLAWIADHSSVPIAAGEEWRTVFDARARLERRAVAIMQPEMGHTGVTQFMRMANLAAAHHARVIPHATIGCGIFMAASLHASAAVYDLPYHEYQPTIFHRNAALLTGEVTCAAGAFTLPTGPGHGVVPSDAFWQFSVPA